ncbi:guanine nucleotide exchange factor MSS4-like [Sycon ciliatum]|uniref:guanine nucleotide exchange factor MSS4-like n=1 Tax=Sycon ciliatum TaxID=27933 RepID=UPI0020AD0BEA|eukprot:scpid81516/ scgid31109/ Guanine nucleotide exchange factor MSS4; Rab-interacting factor
MSESTVAAASGPSLDDNGKNGLWLICKRCGSKIVEPGVALFVDQERRLPAMEKKAGIELSADGEALSSYFKLTDMMQFENVGFTLPHQGRKFLICADCEIGPIGVVELDSPSEFWVALDRVVADASGAAAAKARPQFSS